MGKTEDLRVEHVSSEEHRGFVVLVVLDNFKEEVSKLSPVGRVEFCDLVKVEVYRDERSEAPEVVLMHLLRRFALALGSIRLY